MVDELEGTGIVDGFQILGPRWEEGANFSAKMEELGYLSRNDYDGRCTSW